MTCAASGIAIPAASSALRKWRAVRVEREGALAEREDCLRMGQEADGERQALMAGSPTTAEVKAVGDRLNAAMRAKGYVVKTYGEAEADDAVAARLHRHEYQAPKEVWWGLVALALATAAGIWDVWL